MRTIHDRERHERWRRRRVAGGAALVAAALLGAGVDVATRTPASASSAGAGVIGRLTVTGSGSVSGTPDEATITLGASTTASSAVAALEQNDAEIAQVETLCRAHGVAPADLATQNLDVGPNFGTNGSITGYTASDELTVTVKGIGRVGPLLDAAARVVGNDIEINSISFAVADTAQLAARARLLAVAAARSKASALAAAAHESIRGVLSISDDEQQSAPPSFAPLALARSAAASVPLERGTQVVSAQVSVVYEIAGSANG